MDAGRVIQSRYELIELLGTGGMAEVWRAEDRNLQRPVAIKFLAPQLSNDPEFLVRFFSEAQAVARISHPGVVKVLDFGEDEGCPYLVMEVVDGGSLADITGDPVEPDRAVAIVAAAAGAAGAAHELGIVHRDIKPGNVLLDDDGNTKLADFGIAASVRSERLTATGAAIGSPHYISPEHASGAEVTPASDVYSLGILLYELLCGRRPFEGENVTAVAIAQVEREPEPPSTHIPELGAAVDALVLKCLAKDPASRFADGNDLATALERFDPLAAGDVAVAAGPTWWRDRRAVAGISAAVLLLAVPIFGAIGSPEDAVATADDDSGPLPKVGGLRIDKSPSPTLESVEPEETRPTPSPTPTEEEEDATKERTGGSGDEEEPEPEPTPEPEESAAQPSPEPTTEDNSSPAP